MKRLNIRTLLLELTRECNLSCKHCFRGESENFYMNPNLINKVFKNTARINTLLLTGGEPLLALNQLERLRDVILSDRTNISEIIIVTNGTILTDEIIAILKDISTRANLEIKVSNDAFHELELQKNNLKELKTQNIIKLQELFKVDLELPNEKVYIVDRVGRGATLTQEDLDYINTIDPSIKYVFGSNRRLEEYRKSYPLPKLLDEDYIVDGSLNIDVFGNITPTYYSYNAEDRSRYSNIRGNKTLLKAIKNIKD